MYVHQHVDQYTARRTVTQVGINRQHGEGRYSGGVTLMYITMHSSGKMGHCCRNVWKCVFRIWLDRAKVTKLLVLERCVVCVLQAGWETLLLLLLSLLYYCLRCCSRRGKCVMWLSSQLVCVLHVGWRTLLNNKWNEMEKKSHSYLTMNNLEDLRLKVPWHSKCVMLIYYNIW